MLRTAASAVLAASLVACAGSETRAKPPTLQTVPAPPITDASYDWHGLVVAPFGSALKEIPLPLHEVLLFRDDARSDARSDEPECYASDAAPPRFLGHSAEEYVLCFKQDRLARIQAGVRLPMTDAPAAFAAACALWSKDADQAGSAACEGRDGAVHYSGHVEEDSEAANGVVSIVLDATPGQP
jgi:hypothetical protein